MTDGVAVRRTGRKNAPERRMMAVLAYLLFILLTLAVLLPFYVLIVTSLTSNSEIISTMRFIPYPKQGATAEAYNTALFSDILQTYGISVFRGFFNTLWQTIPPVIIGLFVSGLSGFAFAKLNFPCKKLLFTVLMGTIMIPGTVLTMPSYIFYDALGLSGTVIPLMLPGMFGSVMTVFFLSQFFYTIPTDLVEAAKMDGMGYLQMYVSIMIPLAKPAFLAQFIFAFVGGYNSYLGPLLYLNGQIKLYPLQMVLTLFRSMYSSNQPVICAFILLALLPLLLIYVFTQRYFIEGIATSGVKG